MDTCSCLAGIGPPFWGDTSSFSLGGLSLFHSQSVWVQVEMIPCPALGRSR